MSQPVAQPTPGQSLGALPIHGGGQPKLINSERGMERATGREFGLRIARQTRERTRISEGVFISLFRVVRGKVP